MTSELDQMRPMMEKMGFGKQANGEAWKSDFCEADGGFSVRAIVPQPEDHPLAVFFEWQPHQPSEEEKRALNQTAMTRAMHLAQFYAAVHCSVAYNIFVTHFHMVSL